MQRRYAYNLFIRRNNKYIRANKQPLTALSANNLGHQIVENNAARSFYLKRVAGKPTTMPNLQPMPFYQYRNPVSNSKLSKISFVEKSKYAINTPGELRQITFRRLSKRGRYNNRKRTIYLKSNNRRLQKWG
jgi:hypothetical protein